MKTWITPEAVKLNVSYTEHSWSGEHLDGGYIGDLQVSGHQAQGADSCVKEFTTWWGDKKVCNICANELPEMGS